MTVVQPVLRRLWYGRPLSGDDVIVLLLLLAMAASLIHLVTMLVTRWGDRNIAIKSLIASLLVHSVCLLGLEVFEPLPARRPRKVFEPAQVLTEVLVQSDEELTFRESGNTPVPEEPTRMEIDLDRLPPPARTLTAAPPPQRQAERPPALQADLPEADQFLDRQEPTSDFPEDTDLPEPRESAAQDPAADLDIRHEHHGRDGPEVPAQRMASQIRRPEKDPSVPARPETAGRMERIDPRVELESVGPDLAVSDVRSARPVRDPQFDEDIRRRSAPVSASEPVESSEAGSEPAAGPTGPAASLARSLPRAGRSRRPAPDRLRPSRMTSSESRTPLSLSSGYEDVRVGMRVPDRHGAARLEADLTLPEEIRIRRRDRQPAAYRLRSREYRREAVYRFGGTERSEATVERSLAWLSRQQLPDGRWDASAHGAGLVKIDELKVDRDYSGRDADTGITALVTLAFLGAGYTHEQGRYAIQVDRALDWIIRQQADDGSLAGPARKYARMYCHAMATYALAEALGMQEEAVPDPIVDPDLLAPAVTIAAAVPGGSVSTGQAVLVRNRLWMLSATALADAHAWSLRRVDELRLRTALLSAVRFTIGQQSEGGGWRYARGQAGDVSMFGWQLMSLKSAEIAGVRIPRASKDRMFRFISSVRQGTRGGLFGYRPGEPVTPAMTAEALFCQQMLGFRRDTARSRESVRYLLDHLPRLSELNLYYWYYGTLAMYQFGGPAWDEWNAAVRDTLIAEQVASGPLAGSWDPNGPWGRYGGRLYSTALATLTLEVYYRLLPLYRMSDPE